MADNYLERRMEDYRQGKLGRYTPQHHITEGPLAGQSILVVGEGTDIQQLQAKVMQFVKQGAKVCFTYDDRRQGALIAQRTGTTYLPGMTAQQAQERAVKLRGVVDRVVTLR